MMIYLVKILGISIGIKPNTAINNVGDFIAFSYCSSEICWCYRKWCWIFTNLLNIMSFVNYHYPENTLGEWQTICLSKNVRKFWKPLTAMSGLKCQKPQCPQQKCQNKNVRNENSSTKNVRNKNFRDKNVRRLSLTKMTSFGHLISWEVPDIFALGFFWHFWTRIILLAFLNSNHFTDIFELESFFWHFRT